MRLFHLPGTRSSRVLWTLEEIGAPYELTVFSGWEKASAEHRRRHALGRVPVLELDDGTFVFESGAICLHLADLHPEAQLTAPIGSTQRAQIYQWSFFAMGEMENSVYGWMRARRAGQDETDFAQRFTPIGELLAAALGDRPWLLGERFTVADVLCSSVLAALFRNELGRQPPELRAYADRARQRPANRRARAM